MPIDPGSAAKGVDGEAVIDAAVSAYGTPERFAHAKGVVLINPSTGLPYAATGGGGGGGGDASAANQLAGNASLASIDTDIGALDSAAAAADGTGNYGLIAAAKRALLNWASLLARVPTLGAKAGSGSVSTVPATDAIHAIGTPRVASQPVGISVQTAATGSSWAPFGAQACRSLQLRNNAIASTTPATAAAVNLRWRYAAQPTVTFALPAGAVETVMVAANANEIEIQRVDQASTPIPLTAIAYA